MQCPSHEGSGTHKVETVVETRGKSGVYDMTVAETQGKDTVLPLRAPSRPPP